MFAHVQRMPVAFFTRTQTGALVSRLNTDVVGAQQAFTSTLSSVVSNVIGLVLVLATMLYLSWQITLGALVLTPLFLLPARWVGRRLQAITREAMQLNAGMGTTMTERFNVSGALLVKLFGRLPDESAAFADKAGQVRDIGIKQAMYGRVFFTSLDPGRLAGDRPGLRRRRRPRHRRHHHGRHPGGPDRAARPAVRPAHRAVQRAGRRDDRAGQLRAGLRGARPAADDRREARRRASCRRGATDVELRNVSFRYPSADEVSLASLESVAVLDQAPSQQVLHDVSFVVPAGTMTALVGPSGAGKTTITSLVGRLYDTVEGEVLVGGHDVRDVTLASLHETVGVVTQDAHMFHETIRTNLLYARPDATDAELLDALRGRADLGPGRRRCPTALDTTVGDRGYRLSGGEKQRLAIARLLLKAPDVVVLDEATAHLDSESEVAVQRALKIALEGRTSLVIAHRLSTVRDADQILVVDDGRIVERGRHEELLRSGGLYSELYRTQFAPQERGEDAPVEVA